MATAASELTVLNRRRGNIKSQMTKLLTFLDTLTDLEEESVLSAKIETVSRLQTQFEELKVDYYKTLNDKDLVEMDKILSGMDEELDDIEVRIKSILYNLRKTPSSNSNIEKQNCYDSIKLPEIPLPKFAGQLEDWFLFKTQFLTIIDSHKSLTDSQKLYYLQSSLLGVAKQVQTQDDTYSSLLKALEQRFENKRLIVNTHINGILFLDKIKTDSAKDLRSLIDKCLKHLRSLKLLKLESNCLTDIFLINVIIQKLDSETRKCYEMTLTSKDVPTWDTFIEFLQQRCQVLENINRTIPYTFKQKQVPNDRSKSFINSGNLSNGCAICKLPHSIYKCNTFQNMKVSDRFDQVKKLNLCINCLKEQHKVKDCKTKLRCHVCNKPHHTLLHIFDVKCSALPPATSPHLSAPIESSAKRDDSLETENHSHAFSTCLVSKKKKYVLLPTAIVYVRKANGEYLQKTAVLDSGSQLNFIANRTALELGLKKEKINASVSGLGEIAVTVDEKINSMIANRTRSFSASLDFLIVPTVTNLTPMNPVNLKGINIPSHINLANPEFFKPGQIDLLIGCELFFDLLRPNKFRSPCGQLLFQESVFGYIVVGKTDCFVKNLYCGLNTHSQNIDQQLRKFWELEEVSSPKYLSAEETECEEHFLKNYTRESSGRFRVKLPVKRDSKVLGHSKEMAIKRFVNIEKRLERSPESKDMYHTFLNNYLELGHMELIPQGERNEVLGKTNYLPHHFVLKDSSTTALRVVFDASAKTSTGVSLNQTLMVGPKLQDDIFDIILRFRLHKYAFAADIAKMYRQVLVTNVDADMQRIVWRRSTDHPLEEYRLKTVTYGTASAAYLAVRVLQQLAIEEKDNFPLASAVTLSQFYMDDLLSGAEDLETAKELQNQLVHMFRSAGMKLYKWSSNERELLQNVPYEDLEYHFDQSKEFVKTLGLIWNPKSDDFKFCVSPSINTSMCTKRSVLSDIAKLFDPLGLLGPIIVRAKIFMQRLWLLKMEWDQPLPEKEAQEWMNFASSLQTVKNVKVNRYVLSDNVVQLELHGFADASKDAFGAAMYLRCLSSSGGIFVNLLCSKSKVAPLKTVTIPRLELCAAVLLAKLMKSVVDTLKLNIDDIHLYSDSSIVLAWIRKEPNSLKTFVANRIATIQQLTDVKKWRHIASAENPADLISRGVDADRLLQNTLWWRGPTILTEWKLSEQVSLPDVNQEEYYRELKNDVKNDCISLSVTDNSFLTDILNISNKYNTVIRVLGYVYRFCNNLRRKCKVSGPLTLQERNAAQNFLIKAVQAEAFPSEVRALKKGNTVAPNSKLKCLHPFLDANQVMRVGGRLNNSNLNYNQKHPAILPAKHKLTSSIIMYYHNKYLHCGPQNLLYNVRQIFWPLNGRNNCRKVCHECLTCFKAKPNTLEQIMAELPLERVNPNVTFNSTGIDFCGPFHIKYKHQRKGVYHKIYVCIFVCFATRAIHLDIVTDLTSGAFIATLKRFIARRGKPEKIFTDNAKNFVGSANELKKLHNLVLHPDESLAEYLNSEGIEWRFIPPRAPNFGGLWEAAVKSFKFHFKRVIGENKLTYEEFLTVSTEIEGILNSRPITPLSSDIEDLEVLTPGHFLIGRPITAISEPSLIDINDNRLKIWKKLTKFVQIFWKKWTNDYLNTLQQRTKWAFQKNNVKIGSLVLIKEDNLPTCKWILGRITELFPGADKNVRVVNVQTKGGIVKRNITKICLLPIDNES